ncbi:MAG: PIN domain-containing protein [Candidatus Sericytochromatia bacterium]|nr:PIN domain-containing protein [Candidatus Tanganyikabacteria bacterium]
MILVDTSVWIDHFRGGNEALVTLLGRTLVLAHPFVVGELACGNLRDRTELLRLLQQLPRAEVARDTEVLQFIEGKRLMGRGIGYVDAHLLAAVALAGSARLWTRDQRLARVARDLGLAYERTG